VPSSRESCSLASPDAGDFRETSARLSDAPHLTHTLSSVAPRSTRHTKNASVTSIAQKGFFRLAARLLMFWTAQRPA